MSLFCIINNKNPTELLNIAWKEQEERVPPWEQQIEVWFHNLDKYIEEINPSKYSVTLRRGVINQFFKFNKIITPNFHTHRRKVH